MWQGKTGYVSVYKECVYDDEVKGERYTWEICGARYDGEELDFWDNRELGDILKQAIIATNGCFHGDNIISNTFGIVNDN